MKQIYIKSIILFTFFLTLATTAMALPWPKPGKGPRNNKPFIAGAELKFRPLNTSAKLSPDTKDTIQVTLIYYRDCEANPGSTYLADTASQMACFYSVKLCEYLTVNLKYSEPLSDGDVTPLCPYNPAKTKCDTAAVSNAGYRMAVYVDTLVLPGNTDDWLCGLLYTSATDKRRMIWYPTKYNPSGQNCALLQITQQPAPYLGQVVCPGPACLFVARIQGINTLSQQNDVTEGFFYIEGTYSNKVYDGTFSTLPPPNNIRYKGNTSPHSAANPLIFQCLGNQRIYDLGYYDVDNHDMKFYKATPFKAACFGDPACGQTDRTLNKLSYQGGCSEDNPLCGSSQYDLDQNTGIITLTAAGPVGKYKTAVRIVETDPLNGNQFVGETYRDVVITIINPPNCNTTNSVANSSYFIPNLTGNFLNCTLAPNRDKVIEACAGTPIRFSVYAFSTSDIPNAALNITGEIHKTILNTGGYIQSTYIPHAFPTFDTAKGTLYWNIPDSIPAGIYPVVFQIRDCVDGYILSRTIVYKIRVNKPNKINWSYLGFSPQLTNGIFQLNPKSNRTYNCGSGLSLFFNATGAETGALFNWDLYRDSISTATFVTSNTDNTQDYFNPQITDIPSGKNYKLVLTTNQYCNNKDTITIVDKPAINPTLTLNIADSCFSTVGKLEVKGMNNINGTYYDWQGLKSEFKTTPSYLSNTADPILLRPSNFYNVYVITPDTCIFPLSIEIPTEGIKPRAEYATDKQYVCPADTINVVGVATTSICGNSQFSVRVGNVKTATYDGTQSNTNPTPKIFTATPAIDRGRTEILYQAKELRKKNFKPGLVTALSFFIDGINDPSAYNSIDIYVKCTPKTDLANGQFEDQNYMIHIGSYTTKALGVGWNKFTLSTPFTWDGETNLLFDIQTSCNRACSGDVATSPAYGDHLTNYVSIIGKYGNGQQAFENSSVVTSNYRHNIMFDYYDLDESSLTFKWQDVTPFIQVRDDNVVGGYRTVSGPPDSNTIIGKTIINPRFVSEIPRSYLVTNSFGKCKSYDTVQALVDTNYSIKATPSQAFKCPGDTVHIQSDKGYLIKRPLKLVCAFSNKVEDSCRSVDSLFYPIIGTTTSTAGSVLQSPFGGVNATLGNPTTDKRIQLLYTQAELAANPNMRPGYIRQLRFDVTGDFANTNKLMNFSIKMKCVKNTQDSFANNDFEALATFEEVFFATEYEPLLGPNYINLVKEFAWDSTSGIMIDICFDNFTGSSYNSKQVRSTTYTKKRCLYKASNVGDDYGCNYTTGVRDFIRPNIGFIICKPTRTPPPIPSSVNWAPFSFISNTQITNPVVYNEFTTKYYIILDYVDTTYGKNKVVCRVRDTVNSIVDRPVVKFDPPTVVACEGRNAIVTAGVVGMNSNLYSYEWDTISKGLIVENRLNPNQIITPPNPGYYYVKVASLNNPNCYNSDSIFVGIQPLKTMPDIGGAALICPGDSLLLSIPSELGYKNPKWRYNGTIFDTTFQVKVSKPGDYSMIIDSGACTNTSAVKVVTYRTPSVATLYDTIMTICEGDSAVILYNMSDNVSNPLWNNGLTTPVIKVTQPGQYYLIKPRDQYGCLMLVRDTANVTVIDNPDFKLTDDTLCLSSNQKTMLQPVPLDPSATYYWEPTNRYSFSIDVYTPGEYKVTRRKGQCEKVVYATVVNDTAGAIYLGPNRAVCCDEVITLDANPDGKKYRGYTWSTGEFSQVIYSKPNASGLYIVEAIKPNGCKDTGSIFIDSKCGQVKAHPEKEYVNLGQTNNILANHLGIKADKITYKWIPSEKFNEIINEDSLNSIAKAKDTGDVEYVLVMTVIDSNYSPTKTCIENEVIRFKVLPNGLKLPNAFSPNGDGIHDDIYPNIKGVVKMREFKVYNRFGQLLHNDANKPWDGKFNGELQPLGVYVGLVSYEYEEPKKPMEVKYEQITITLVR